VGGADSGLAGSPVKAARERLPGERANRLQTGVHLDQTKSWRRMRRRLTKEHGGGKRCKNRAEGERQTARGSAWWFQKKKGKGGKKD